MKTLLYHDLVPFYHLVDPLEDHADEGEEFGSVLKRAVANAATLLELGSGAGHGAHFVKRGFVQTVLADLSPAMLDISRQLNPDCEHIEGDMRSLRLGRTFDCVLVHDAISYMLNDSDLLGCMRTAFEHLRPGGAALLVPDCTTESFKDCYEDLAGDDDHRAMRCMMWSYDPDPLDTTHLTDFAFLLREGNGEVRAVHDRHTHGLFSTDTWRRLGREAGFEVEVVRRPLPDGYEDSAYTGEMFLCTRPL